MSYCLHVFSRSQSKQSSHQMNFIWSLRLLKLLERVYTRLIMVISFGLLKGYNVKYITMRVYLQKRVQSSFFIFFALFLNLKFAPSNFSIFIFLLLHLMENLEVWVFINLHHFIKILFSVYWDAIEIILEN